MSTTTNTTAKDLVNVGDKVIHVPSYHNEPRVVTVTKVTKTTIEIFGGPSKFRLESNYDWKTGEREHYFEDASKYNNKGKVFLYSDEKWAKVMEAHNDHLAIKATEKAIKEEKAAKRAAEHAAELETVKSLVGELKFATLHKSVTPTGTRLYLLNAPVNEIYRERKGGWETILVHCKTVEDTWNAKLDENGDYILDENGNKIIPKVTEMAYTYANGSTHSFASVSTSKYDNDEDAVWEALRSVYYSW